MSSRPDAIHRLNSVLTHLARQIRRVDDAQGQGRARLSALAVLHFGGPCSPGELAEAELVTAVTMHHIVKGLEADGLVLRERDPDDGRRRRITLTAAGTAVIVEAHARRLAFLTERAQALTSEALSATVAVLETIRDVPSPAVD